MSGIKKRLFGRQGGALSKREKCVRLAWLAPGLVCLFYGLIPLFGYGIAHAGVIALLGGGVLLTALAYGRPGGRKKHPRIERAVKMLLWGTLLLALTAYLTFAVAYRVYCATHEPPEGEYPQTIIVLGGAIQGDSPKLMLRRRLDAAAAYMNKNTQAACVVSGGQGADESVSEAFVMQKYLIEQGIDAKRIVLEDRSTNTRENLAFSAAVIAQANLSQDVTVATDSFHQLRAGVYAKRAGFRPSAISSHTPWGLLPSYELREMAGLVKAFLGM